ncbi:H-2 class II histocompatibility antigen, E-S beta chain-like isoform X2 [Colossoma macropomum]|uniref:H-2 class II histocompatibility antigen, E-S beta chain-like isoform X2 n=1 Tax=Colossoma macropomum TaxID=42526 RepID=UPI0018653662|nr:H-2 class II histocompatibility antigen, E-S beta chain-like isoform X2 [Colossoma macropomum]
MLLILQLLLALTLSIRTGGYYHYTITECISSSADLSDLELIDTYYFNKIPDVQFNSTVGKYVGFTEVGEKQAEVWNSGPELQQMKAALERYCKPNRQIHSSAILEKAVKPVVQLMLDKHASGGHPALLMCSAYDFYPPAIDVYWLRDGKKVTTDMISTAEMADGDWYYQIHSHLEYTPTSGEKISCVVDHASSKEPIIYEWDPSLPESDRNKIAFGASGLVLGIILSAAGFMYYKKKSSGIL